MTTNPNEEQPIDFCMRCLMPLTRSQIAATIHGQSHEWAERMISTCNFHLCRPCRDAVKEGGKGGLKAAIKRAGKTSHGGVHENKD